MELDDFKTIWKTTPVQQAGNRSAGELEQSIHRSTVTLLGKVKRSIAWEAVLCILFIPLCGWAWFHYPFLYSRCCGVLITILCICFIAWLVRLYKKIVFFETADFAVKERLAQITGILQQFTRLYFRFSMGMLPVGFVAGLLTGYLDVIHRPLLAKSFHWEKGFWVYLGLFAGWSLLMYVFSKWYIKKLYGNYLAGIRQQLADLENG